MKRDRYFYSATAATFLALILLGFRHYIFGARLSDGSPILPLMLAAVIAHSTAVFAWYLLYFAQSLLIATRNRRVHARLGWSVLVIAGAIAVTGPLAAYRETVVENATVFEWPARPFLLVMLAEIALFLVFVILGVLTRKQPRMHRPMMLLAGLSLISGATARIPLVNSIFGLHQWLALFAPVTVLGGLFLLLRWAMTRSLDRVLATGYAALVLATLLVSRIAMTGLWDNLAGILVGH